MNTKLIVVHAITPLQPGTGRGLGIVDLPIAREVATGLPYLPGSSFKGVLRDRSGKNGETNRLFGPETDNASDHAGAVQFTDMRLLLLPVRSLAGTFAWVTSPFVLHRFARDCQMTGLAVPGVPAISNIEKMAVSADSSLFARKGEVVLEDLLLKQESGADLDGENGWASFLASHIFPTDAVWQETLKVHLCLVHDDAFSFLLQIATEVVARIRLQDESKTVAKGGLWYEEMLPAETILTGLVVAQQVDKTSLKPDVAITKVRSLLNLPIFQFGGNATVGRGLCRVVMSS